MTRTISNYRRASLFRTSCWIYSQLLFLYPDDLYARYGEEMRWVFREELKRAVRHGLKEYMALWRTVLHDTALQMGSTLVSRLGIVGVAVTGALAITLAAASFSLPRRLPEIGEPCLPQVDAASIGTHPKRTANSSATLKSGRSDETAYLPYVPPKRTKR
jgi:hypothetical protein